MTTVLVSLRSYQTMGPSSSHTFALSLGFLICEKREVDSSSVFQLCYIKPQSLVDVLFIEHEPQLHSFVLL